MASETDICNIALSHLGARAQIASIVPPDGTVEAGYCARFYPIARREVIEAGNWSFVKVRAPLTPIDNDSTVWAYAYALPANCIKALRVLPLTYATLAGAAPILSDDDWRRIEDAFTERGSADFELESDATTGQRVLRTNEPEAVLLYKRDVTDTTRFTPLMTSAVGMILAGYLAGPIIKGLDGAKVGSQWRQMGFDMLAKAGASDANASSEKNDHLPAHIAAR